MIKKIIGSFSIILLLGSCGTHKKIVDTDSKKDLIDFNLVLDQVKKTYIQDSTIAFNSRLQYIKNGSSQPKVSVQTNIRNNESIWVNASLIIPLGRMLITPEGAKGYAKIPKKVYFDSDYSFIEDKIHMDNLEYEQLESLLTARPLFELNSEDYTFEKVDSGYVFKYKKNAALLESKSAVDVIKTVELNNNFVVTREEFIKPDTNMRIEVSYSDFEMVGKHYFPKNMQILIFDKKNIEVKMEHKTIKVNTVLQTPFKLPTSYKKIDF